ncbi:MAG: hypothetical protein AAFX02_10110 [Pseudomonadota bacterium]
MNGFLEQFEDLDQTALAQHVMHRRVVLNLLEQALRRTDETGKYQLEALIHRLVHPMRTTSDEIEFDEQNLWLLDDRLTYHSYLGSDKELKTANRLESTSPLRPDLLAVFDRVLPFAEGTDPRIAFSIVEFKRPDRGSYSDKSPISQVFDVVRDIRDGQFKDLHGRPLDNQSKQAPAYCYVICDLTPQLERRIEDATGQLTPDGRGYFGYNPGLRAYFEVVSYEKMVGDALKRNRMLFQRLGLPAGKLADL